MAEWLRDNDPAVREVDRNGISAANAVGFIDALSLLKANAGIEAVQWLYGKLAGSNGLLRGDATLARRVRDTADDAGWR